MILMNFGPILLTFVLGLLLFIAANFIHTRKTLRQAGGASGEEIPLGARVHNQPKSPLNFKSVNPVALSIY